MQKRLLYIILTACCLLFSEMATAEVVYLKSGGKISGTIVFQNEEVVVIKDANGARFQYMMTDVDRIGGEEVNEEKEDVKAVAYNPHKVAVSVQLAGGGSIIPQGSTAGTFQGDLVIGTAKMADRPILFGGGIGYHAVFVPGADKKTISFLPIQIRAEIPFLDGTHAPMMAAGLGYGIALNKGVKGGIFADFNFGWRYQPNGKRALFLGAFANFQNAQMTITEVINKNEYTGTSTRNFCNFGAKFSIYL